MKCPKCGYNSFENNDACPKCLADLTGFKGTFGLSPLIFPGQIRSTMAEAMMTGLLSVEQSDVHTQETAHDDMFAFDIASDTPAASLSKDPFDFGEEPPTPVMAKGGGEFSFDDEEKKPGEADPFASLLESTSQADDDPFASLGSVSTSTATNAAEPTNGTTELDLNSFSWDETTSTVAAPENNGASAASDEFDSLFSDLDDAAKK